MNYESNLARYNALINCNNQLFLLTRERYSIIVNKLLICRDPVKTIQYKAILNSLDRILEMFLNIEFSTTN